MTIAVKGTLLEDVRTLAHRLRPDVLDELGLVPALRNLCDRIGSGTGLVAHRSLPASLAGLSEEELVIYRVAQESLTNVVRHAGATTAHVTLSQEDGAVELGVTDDGVGMPAGEQAGGGSARPAGACVDDRREAPGHVGGCGRHVRDIAGALSREGLSDADPDPGRR